MASICSRRKFITLLLGSAAAACTPFSSSRAALAGDETAIDTVIIGGGVSGLTAAYLLEEQDILLLEAEPHFGGRTLGGIHNGWHYTKGTEYIGAPYGVLEEIIDDFDLEPVEIPWPMDEIWRNNKFYRGSRGRIQLLLENGGLETFNRFLEKIQPIYLKYSNMASFRLTGELARLDRISCRELFDELRLPAAYFEMYNVTFRGLFGANIDEVSALGAIPEIGFDFEEMDAPFTEKEINALISNPSSDTSGAYSFKYGISEVTNALAADLGKYAIHSAEVTAVTGNDTNGYVVTYRHNGVSKDIRTDSVIFATPVPVTLRIGSAVLTPPQKRLLEQVPYCQYITAALFSDTPIYTTAFDLALPNNWFATDVYDATWMQKKLGEQHKGHVASVYIGPRSYKDTGLIHMTDKEILERSYAELQAIWPDIRNKVKGYDIHRFPHAYPVMTPGAYKRLTELYGLLTGGVQIAGDGMMSPTFEAAVDTAAIAVKRIKKWLS